MANQTQTTAATRAKDSSSTPIPVHRENGHIYDRVNGEVARKAYELYEQAGNLHGQDMNHWLQAETQVLRRIPEIRESSSWYTINVPVPGFSVEEVHVGVEPTRAIIAASRSSADSLDKSDGEEKSSSSRSENESAHSESFRESVFLVAEWPGEVDPSTASAYIKNENLTLTVKRAAQAPSHAE